MTKLKGKSTAEIRHGAIVVATGCQCVAIRQVQPAGKRVMDTSEFLRGHPVQVGERFGGGE